VIEASLVYHLVERVEWTLMDLLGWERVGKGVGSLENHTVQEGPLVVLD
jgi:hypothetical protein